MRAVVTGATGFIGGAVSRALIARGDDVTAIVRNPLKSVELKELGATLVEGDITDAQTLEPAMRSADALYHFAAWYELGITDRSKMFQENVRGTENVLNAAANAGISKILHCSSVAVLGAHEHGEISNEETQHPGTFGSAYEETKWESHRRVVTAQRNGAPIVIAMPGAVYGPGDPSMVGAMIRYYAKGWLIACPFLQTGFSWVNVNDLADGLLCAMDKGRVGESYILGGENLRIGQLFEVLESVTGIRPPRFEISERLVRLSVPLSPLLGKLMQSGPRILTDALSTMRGSFMASSAKAERELGYAFRNVVDAMPETVEYFREL
ncbi:MAG: NAD-dependent epimerase/dehydratase family protein [Actinomycetota bacterium]